jgi:arylsulfatase A-like enzyme
MTMDVTASILAETNTPVPADTRLDGINLFPILAGRSPVVERTLFWRVTGNRTQRAVRSGDWKLIVDNGIIMVFDVQRDLGERNDLTNRQQALARRLRQLIAAWETDVDAEARANGTITFNVGTGRGRGAGAGAGGRGAASSPARPVD